MSTRTTYREQDSAITIGLETDETLPASLHNGGLMRPTRVHIRWFYSITGWQRDITVHGKQIRKDGTLGVRRQLLRIVEYGSFYANDLPLEDAPEWLQAIIEDHTPPVPQDHLARWEVDQ